MTSLYVVDIRSVGERADCETGGDLTLCAGIGAWNPAFDVAPAELITGGIVTEFGVFKPDEMKEKLLQNLSKES